MDRPDVRSTGMRCVSAVVASVVVLVAFACPPSAQAGCVGAVVVDGAVLLASDAYRTLPRPAGRVPAVVPACNDGGPRRPDGRTTVVRLAGVPADVAVRSTDGSRVYLAQGSLTALAAHPLHRRSRRLVRRHCVVTPTREGTAGLVTPDSIELIAGATRRLYRIDGRSTLANQPAYQPVRRGQRLSIAAAKCGTRLIADRIVFTGPRVVPRRYVGQATSPPEPGFPWLVALPIGVLGLALVVASIERVTRP